MTSWAAQGWLVPILGWTPEHVTSGRTGSLLKLPLLTPRMLLQRSDMLLVLF